MALRMVVSATERVSIEVVISNNAIREVVP